MDYVSMINLWKNFTYQLYFVRPCLWAASQTLYLIVARARSNTPKAKSRQIILQSTQNVVRQHSNQAIATVSLRLSTVVCQSANQLYPSPLVGNTLNLDGFSFLLHYRNFLVVHWFVSVFHVLQFGNIKPVSLQSESAYAYKHWFFPDTSCSANFHRFITECSL